MLSCANPMSLTSSGISDSSTPDAWTRGNNGNKTLIPPRRCDSMKKISILTNLNVTFLLFWGSSTIFCKLAATGRRQKKREHHIDDFYVTFTFQAINQQLSVVATLAIMPGVYMELTNDQVPPINQTCWDQLLRNSIGRIWAQQEEKFKC